MNNKLYGGLIAIGLLVGLPLGATIDDHLSRPKIIQYGAGHYDQITGQFEWGAPLKLANTPVAMNNSQATMYAADEVSEKTAMKRLGMVVGNAATPASH